MALQFHRILFSLIQVTADIFLFSLNSHPTMSFIPRPRILTNENHPCLVTRYVCPVENLSKARIHWSSSSRSSHFPCQLNTISQSVEFNGRRQHFQSVSCFMGKTSPDPPVTAQQSVDWPQKSPLFCPLGLATLHSSFLT